MIFIYISHFYISSIYTPGFLQVQLKLSTQLKGTMAIFKLDLNYIHTPAYILLHTGRSMPAHETFRRLTKESINAFSGIVL